MRKFLFATCAVTALGGLVMTEGALAQTQAPPSPSQPSEQPGIRRVDPSMLVMMFYTANPADFRVSNLMGKSVYNLNNERIGEVNDIVINDGKTIKAIVVGVGGFLGMGERSVAVDPGSVLLTEQPDGSARLVVNTTKEELKKAPPFNEAEVDKPGPNAKSKTGDASKSKPM
jgi:sporulation protein YlmC with PRC-barrel domain